MHHDDRTVGRIFSRREALLAAARAGVGLAVGGAMARRVWADTAPTTQPKLHLVASPSLTEGPFFVDEKLNRSNLTTGITRPSVVNGLPLVLTFTVYRLSGKEYAPLSDAHVDVWHTDADGVYSDESDPMNPENTAHQTWLRGYQVTDAAGLARFTTIVPGWYGGRAPHIHFKVRQFAGNGAGNGKVTAEFTSQLFLHEQDADRVYAQPPYNTRGQREVHNRDDGIYNERLQDGTTAGDAMLLDLKPNSKAPGYTTTFAIALTDANLRPGGRRGGPGGPPPRGRGGPPPRGG